MFIGTTFRQIADATIVGEENAGINSVDEISNVKEIKANLKRVIGKEKVVRLE